MKLVLTLKIRTLFQRKTEVFCFENTNIFILWNILFLTKIYFKFKQFEFAEKCAFFDG